MRGYCETCTEVVTAVDVDPEDGYDDTCPNCGDDVHPGVHVEGEPDEYVEDEADFDEWLLQE